MAVFLNLYFWTTLYPLRLPSLYYFSLSANFVDLDFIAALSFTRPPTQPQSFETIPNYKLIKSLQLTFLFPNLAFDVFYNALPTAPITIPWHTTSIPSFCLTETLFYPFLNYQLNSRKQCTLMRWRILWFKVHSLSSNLLTIDSTNCTLGPLLLNVHPT